MLVLQDGLGLRASFFLLSLISKSVLCVSVFIAIESKGTVAVDASLPSTFDGGMRPDMAKSPETSTRPQKKHPRIRPNTEFTEALWQNDLGFAALVCLTALL